MGKDDKQMKLMPLYIFDIDGTLALIDHRKHYLENKNDSHRWRKFYDACDNDKPNKPVIETLNRLGLFADVWFFSGRSSEVREKTIQWIDDNTNFSRGELETCLMMRDEGDYTPDHELKKSWLDSMLEIDRERLIAVFDDRDRVVNMWRENGVACFQVAKGDF